MKALDNTEYTNILRQMYLEENKSSCEIASLLSKNVRVVQRHIKSLGLTRSHSESQKNAIKSGRTKPPMEGRTHKEESKLRIGQGNAEAWKNASDERKSKMSEQSKELWKSRSDSEQTLFDMKSRATIVKTARQGSKLERFLYEELKKDGYLIEIHKKHLFNKVKMHIDLLLPKNNVAIEIDGVSHYKPIYGADVLAKTQFADNEKNSILLKLGFNLLRIRVGKRNLSKTLAHDVLEWIKKQLVELQTQRGNLIIKETDREY